MSLSTYEILNFIPLNDEKIQLNLHLKRHSRLKFWKIVGFDVRKQEIQGVGRDERVEPCAICHLVPRIYASTKIQRVCTSFKSSATPSCVLHPRGTLTPSTYGFSPTETRINAHTHVPWSQWFTGEKFTRRNSLQALEVNCVEINWDRRGNR